MKIYLASYWEPENHGTGRKVGIASAPRNLADEAGYTCELQYEGLNPGQAYWDYHKEKKAAGEDKGLVKKAGENFNESYKARLQEFKSIVEAQAKENDSTVFDIVGLEDEDTLLSWEREGNPTFRVHTAELLRELGYEVEEC